MCQGWAPDRLGNGRVPHTGGGAIQSLQCCYEGNTHVDGTFFAETLSLVDDGSKKIREKEVSIWNEILCHIIIIYWWYVEIGSI